MEKHGLAVEPFSNGFDSTLRSLRDPIFHSYRGSPYPSGSDHHRAFMAGVQAAIRVYCKDKWNKQNAEINGDQ